ncbi:CTM1 (YHR109W) [Zygosaccharomyces parabailii]|uniref:ZYBA0S08-00870g1_1 n=1 Tax=Zygosaccharomyces bailii (strain CLIB 213 / ATCC 58445 / CBS 680 / BCRC 21525 / NBRC 1098 / NCYC 1416 / NRRL Y-2227) TaxID=1333698 RepID=A0A8J2XCF0_ZYGB2|nr:CTM1 (YHR109W) [Zygosaccharomyces parabailii]CDF90700.1 ZYBA0S08-00870g1_1 [Zygosaccharomyces bailii CLIB 213]CDH14176.1 related to Cytochrome c lysine N-methyltransferase 1 [Zygosaccharomyces bailii ISA1307]
MADILQWFCENTDVVVHESVKICPSAVDDPCSGYGLFVDMANEKVTGEALEVLRIPKRLTFDIHTILALLSDENQYSSKAEFQKTNKRVKTAVAPLLECEDMQEVLSESTILVYYFLLCTLLKNSYELPAVLRYYLENVILITRVGGAADFSHLLAKFYGHYLSTCLLNQTLTKIKHLFEAHVPEFELPTATLCQVYAAVKSRCLEIPQELDKKSDDFVVNSTLVPLLDFCNHSSVPNACFDIDRSTGDVLLLLDLSNCKPVEGLQEVLILYHQVAELFSFYNTYGFVPPEQEFQFFNLSIVRNFLLTQPIDKQNARLFYKWLHINPVIQLVKYENVWYINDTIEEFAYFLLAFLPDPDDFTKSCWHYDSQSYETFVRFHEQVDGPDFGSRMKLLKFYKNQIIRQEGQSKDYIKLPQLAWSMHYKNEQGKKCRRVTKDQALELAPYENAGVFDRTIQNFELFWSRYLAYRKQNLTVSTSSQSFNVLLHLEGDILNSFSTRMQQKQVIFWSDMKLSAPVYMLPPLIWNFAASEEKVTLKDEELCFDLLRLNLYEKEEHSDSCDEELKQFSHFV